MSRAKGINARTLSKIIDSQRNAEKALGYQQFEDPRVDRFIRKMAPSQKRKLQSNLYWGSNRRQTWVTESDHGSGGAHKQINAVENKDLYGLAHTFDENLLQRKVIRQRVSPLRLHNSLFERKKEFIKSEYANELENHSVLLFVEDVSDTLTDVNYENKVKKPINDLKNNDVRTPIRFKNVNADLFKSILHDPVLVEVINKIEVPSAFKEIGGIEPMFKVIYIPSESIDLATDTIEILERAKNAYRLFGVFVNLKTSQKITKELVQVLKGFNDKVTSASSYEALLQIAKESRSSSNVTTKKLLTTIGESDLLKVSVNEDHSISFTSQSIPTNEESQLNKSSEDKA